MFSLFRGLWRRTRWRIRTRSYITIEPQDWILALINLKYLHNTTHLTRDSGSEPIPQSDWKPWPGISWKDARPAPPPSRNTTRASSARPSAPRSAWCGPPIWTRANLFLRVERNIARTDQSENMLQWSFLPKVYE